MKFMRGVSVRGVSPELLAGLMVLDSSYQRLAGVELEVSHLADGIHMRKSKHYRGDGADGRTRAIGISLPTAERIAIDAGEQLGSDFDIIVKEDHIHMEFDPKGPA